MSREVPFETVRIPTGKNGDRLLVPVRTLLIFAAALVYVVTWTVDRLAPTTAQEVTVDSLRVDTTGMEDALRKINSSQERIEIEQLRQLDGNRRATLENATILRRQVQILEAIASELRHHREATEQ